MNQEKLQSAEGNITRQEIVTFLRSRKEEMDKILYAENEKKAEILESSEAKMMLHNWIVQRSRLFSRAEITHELGEICDEAGLKEEALRQYVNAEEIRAAEEIVDEKNK